MAGTLLEGSAEFGPTHLVISQIQRSFVWSYPSQDNAGTQARYRMGEEKGGKIKKKVNKELMSASRPIPSHPASPQAQSPAPFP